MRIGTLRRRKVERNEKTIILQKWKQELREAMREEIDGDYLTEKMVRKMSISDMSHYLNRLALEEAGYCGTMFNY